MCLLVLEDNARLGEVMCQHLRAGGHATELVASAEAFRHAAADRVHELYILDLNLPDGDGIELVREVRRSRKATPILITSGRAELADRVLGLDVGADDYLTKPFNCIELQARVRALLRRPVAMSTRRLTAGELTLDVETGDIYFQDKLVDLRKSERRLLGMLMRRSGRIVPKALIEETLIGYGCEVTPNAVEKLVSRLRRSLSEPPMGVEVKTVRGTGYVLEESRG